jgi:DNA-directed RNA polymerase specialized sigma54-like protein
MARRPAAPKKSAPSFELMVTIPSGMDEAEVQARIRQTQGCQFEPAGFGARGTHGMLIVQAPDQRAAAEIGNRVISQIGLRAGL